MDSVVYLKRFFVLTQNGVTLDLEMTMPRQITRMTIGTQGPAGVSPEWPEIIDGGSA